MSSAVPDLRVIWGNVIFVRFAFSSNDRRAGSGACYNRAAECSRLRQRWRPSLLRGSLANTAGQWQTETGEPTLALSALEDLWQTSEGSKWQWQLCTVGLRTEDLQLLQPGWKSPLVFPARLSPTGFTGVHYITVPAPSYNLLPGSFPNSSVVRTCATTPNMQIPADHLRNGAHIGSVTCFSCILYLNDTFIELQKSHQRVEFLSDVICPLQDAGRSLSLWNELTRYLFQQSPFV